MTSVPSEPFVDIDVSPFAVDSSEQLGTKPKQWLRAPDDRRWLYKWLAEKQALRRRGEDWAEKVVGEIGALVGVPCAVIELAHRGETRGIISLDVVPDGLDLVHGNELLAGRVPGYPRTELRNVADYRVDRVVSVLEDAPPVPSMTRPATEDFAGYLVLDALVANADRHHENWAVLVQRRGSRTPMLAPTFDHASSLACGLTDEEREARLQTKDEGFSVATFARRARSHFADAPMLLSAVARIGEIAPDALLPWRERLAALQIDDAMEILGRLPASRMTTPARDFAAALLHTNYDRLIELMEGLR